MKCLRKAVNKTKRDKIRNEVIRDMAGAKPVLQHIKQQQVKWFGHITRMPINQPALRAYNTKYSGWRARGRPRKRWSDSVADTLKIQGMSLLQATHLAADRQLCPPRDAYRYKRKKKVKVKVKYVSLCAFDGPSVVCHLSHVSSPFPFGTGYVLDCVCHSGPLPKDGAFGLTFSIS